MQIHVINVSIADMGEQEAELNRFLSSHKVVAPQRMEASPKVRTACFAAAVGTATGTSTTPRTAALPTVTTTTPTTATTTSGFVLCFILSSKSPVDAGQDEPVCSTLFPRDE